MPDLFHSSLLRWLGQWVKLHRFDPDSISESHLRREWPHKKKQFFRCMAPSAPALFTSSPLCTQRFASTSAAAATWLLRRPKYRVLSPFHA